MPRFSSQFDNKLTEDIKLAPEETSEKNSLERIETMYDGPKFKNPSDIELVVEEEDVHHLSMNSLAEHTRVENNEINDGSIKELKNYLQIKLPENPYKKYLVFDAQYIKDREGAEKFIDSLSADFVSKEQKREMMSILGLPLEEGVKIPISKIEEEKLDFNKGDKVVWTVSNKVYTVKKIAGDYVIVEELSSPLPLFTVKKVESESELDNSFIKTVKDIEKESNEKYAEQKKEFNSEKLQQFEIPVLPDEETRESRRSFVIDEETKESTREFDPLHDRGVYPVVDISKEEQEKKEPSFDILNNQRESKEKSLGEVKNYLFDYIEKSLPKSESIIPLHKGIDFARSFNEIRSEINDAFNLKIIDIDQKDLMYHLAGLKENEELNKLSQFEIPVLPDEETRESRRSFVIDEETKESTREFDPLYDRGVYPVVDISKEEQEKIDLDKVGQFYTPKEDINDKSARDEIPAVNPTEVISPKPPQEKPAQKEPQILDIKAETIIAPPFIPENSKKTEVDDFEELFKKAEQIDINLDKAREDYASAKKEFLNKHRQKKNVFAKAMFDLGVEKQMPKSDEIPEELKGLERVYIEAKKEKSRYLFAKGLKKEEVILTGAITAETREYSFNEDLVKALEQEMDKFNKVMESGRPPLEKGILSKTLEKWQKLHPATRIALSSTLVTAGAFAFGALPLAGVAAYGGYRVARAAAGAATSQFAGRALQNKFDKNNTKLKEGFLNKYGTDISEDNFAEKEKQARDFYESEKDKKKRQLLWKAGAMVGAGIGTSVASGALLHSIESISAGGAKVSAENVPTSKPSIQAESVPPKVNISEVAKPETVEVELSSKGFIKTFDEMKGKILEKYGNVAKVPENLKHFVETPSTKLAEEFGMYDPEHKLSGAGLKGESLALDSKGNLSYEHLNGNKDVLFDSQKGQVSSFEGKIINSEGEVVPREYIGKTAPMDVDMDSGKVKIPDVPQENISNIPENIETKTKIIEIGGKPFSSLDNLVVDNHTVGLADLEGKKVLVYDNQAIAEEISDPKPGAYPMALADKLQEGKVYTEVRKAFNIAMDKMVEGYKNVGYLPAKLPFEGGVIQTVTDVSNEIGKTDLYLNGKHFASGIITEKGSQVLLDEGVEGSWWSSDNVYERALKASKTNIFENISHLLKN
ncbi:MAG: hypothetical protein WC095_00610 [Candidatus Paceibacterota bacterium]